MNTGLKFNIITAGLTAVLLILIPVALSAAPVEFPDTPAGKRAAEILAMLNRTFSHSAEDYIMNDYAPAFRDSFPMTRHMQIFETTKAMFGTLKLLEIVSASDTEIRFIVQSESRDASLDIMLNVEAEPPHRVAVIGIRPGAPAPSESGREAVAPAAGNRLSPPAETDKPVAIPPGDLDAVIAAKADGGEFSGVVLVAREGVPIYHKAYGYASKRFKAPNRTDTKFNLGSINKSFTTVAVLQLMDQGKLFLDDPIGKYLDIFPPAVAEKVTIRHLLNMRSGWGDFWNHPSYLQQVSRLRKVSEYMAFIKDMPLDFEPGSNFQHSNTGFDVAGAVIEKITGMDYFNYIRKHIYEPAGMTDTDSFDKDGPVENLAVGYTNMNPVDSNGTGYGWENTYMMPPTGTPAGGGYSTTTDMLRYEQALRGYQLMSKAATHFYFNRLEGEPGDAPPPRGRYRAAGGAPGINAFFVIDFASGLTFIVLSNFDHPAAVNLTQEIIKRYGLDRN